MKIANLLLFVITASAACKKNKEPDQQTGLWGKWRYAESYVAQDPLSTWEEKENGFELNLSADSTYEISEGREADRYPFASLFPKGGVGKLTHHNIYGNNIFYFVKKASEDTVFFQTMRITTDTLELWGTCFEKCGYRFIRSK